MPYRRTYRRGRKPMRRKYPTSTRKIARREAKKVVNRAIESKTFDGAHVAGQIDFSGGVTNLLSDPSGGVTITQGVGESQYVGTAIKPTYIKISFNWTLADTTNMVRVVVVQSRGLLVPTMADILQSVGNVRAPLSDYDIDFNDRYNVLADRCYSLDQTNKTQVIGKIKVSAAKLRRIKFSDTAGTYEAGGIYFGYITDSAAVSHPILQAYWRVHYKDG